MKKIIPVTILIAALILAFINCDDSNTLSDVSIKGEIIDAATQDTLRVPVSVQLLGKSGEILQKALGDDMLSFSDGVVTFTVPGALVDDIDFTLVIDVDGYITNSKRFSGLKGDTHSFTLSLINIASPPSGVSILNDAAGAIDASGFTSSETVLTTPTDASISEAATITIPAGIKMLDAVGEPLSGNLTATVSYFSPMDREALRTFPGGLTVRATDAFGEMTESFFVSAGFVSIDITDENGRSAESFDGAELGISLDIPADLNNPEAGRSVRAGDYIPVWSYDKETGEWTFESSVTRAESTVVDGGAGRLKMQFTAKHLSYYNVDWFGPGRVDKSRPIQIKGKPVDDDSVCIILESPKSGYYDEQWISDKEFRLQNVPSFELDVSIVKRQWVGGYYSGRAMLLASKTGVSLGGDDTLILDIDAPQTPYRPYVDTQY